MGPEKKKKGMGPTSWSWWIFPTRPSVITDRIEARQALVNTLVVPFWNLGDDKNVGNKVWESVRRAKTERKRTRVGRLVTETFSWPLFKTNHERSPCVWEWIDFNDRSITETRSIGPQRLSPMSDSGSPFKKQSKEEDVRVHLCGEEHKKSEIKKENAEASSNTIV